MKFIATKLTRRALMLFLVTASLSSCDKKDVPVEESGVPSFNAEQVKVYPGYNRVELVFFVNENAKSCEIFWSKKAKSLKVDLSKRTKGLFKTEIKDLPQGKYDFEIFTNDKDDRSSAVKVSVDVYGDKYESSIVNRALKDVFYIKGETPYIEWNTSLTGEVGVNVIYTDETDKERVLRVKATDVKTELPGYKYNTSITYHSLYLPEKEALDTCITKAASSTLPKLYESEVLKRVIERSGLVNTIVSQSSTSLHEAVQYSNLQFKNKGGEPLSIFIVKVNLNNKDISLSTLMPNNKADFGLQTVQDMAKLKESSTLKVLAAVNADFFDASPVLGRPWGPVFMDGVPIRTVSKEAWLTYFAIKKDGKPQIGVFSALPAASYPDIKDAVGATNRLIIGGKMEYNADVSVHPRTMVGYTKDNIVYLGVIDGRRTGYSAGMKLDDMALIMLSLDAQEAINLDGGGSTTLVVKEQSGLNVINKYSDPAARAVGNGLAVTLRSN